MTECTNAKLSKFGRYHFTYISGFFGNKEVREIITETYPKKAKKYRLDIVHANANFEPGDDSMHHLVFNKRTKKPICSDTIGYQNTDINKNDTLCQSYSLLTFFDIPINIENREQLQKDMVDMYRKILNNKNFMKRLNGETGLVKIPDNSWKDYTIYHKDGVLFDPSMSQHEYLENVRKTLDDWESFGFYYFIGKGTCPKRPLDESEKKNTVNPSNIIHEGRTRKSAKTIMATDAAASQAVDSTGGRRRSTRKNTKSSNK